MACCHSCPVAFTLALGLCSITLGTSRTLLLKFSENAENKYDFLPASVNLLAEALKLLFCLVMSVRVIVRDGRPFRELGFTSSSPVLSYLKWAVPAFLYFLDNLIAFYVMAYLQPVMTVLSSNLVILTTAVLFRVVLKRRLSWVQWAALVILFLSIVSLTTGSGGSQNSNAVAGHHANLSAPSNSCLLYTQLPEQSKNSSAGESGASSLPGQAWRGGMVEKLLCLGAGHILLLLQCFIASMANIYSEKILKGGDKLTNNILKEGDKLTNNILKEGDQLTNNIFIQNSKLYAFGVVFNGLTVWAQGVHIHHGLLQGHNVYSLGLVPVTAALGLSVAFMLKFKDNMFHVLTGQITTVLVTGLSFFLFDFHPTRHFFLQAPMVLLAIFIYNASRPKDPEHGRPQEEPRVINGEVSERSRGDGEELQPLIKTNTGSESEEDSPQF